MKQRKIPYGYQYEKGIVVVSPQESRVVYDICDEYLSGISLQKIAEQLNKLGIEYLPGVTGWNKARLKRIIEDKRYLGTEVFPRIITEEVYESLQVIREVKNTQKNLDRKADIFKLNSHVICPICGTTMYRQSEKRNKCKQQWYCSNSECHTLIAKSDEDFLSDITDLLNIVIINPEYIQVPSNIDTPTKAEIQKLNCEIERTLNGYDYDKTLLRKKMMDCISLKYKNIDDTVYITKRLKYNFAKSEPLKMFSSPLFNQTVKAVYIEIDGTVSIVLMNEQIISKGECRR